MSEKQTYIIINEQVRTNALRAVRQADIGYCVEIKPKTRTLSQNATLHGLCADIAKQRPWAGEPRTTVDWKRIFVDGLIRAEEGQGLPMVPSLDYKGVVTLSEPTRYMGVKRLSDLIEFIYSWSADNWIILTPLKEKDYA